MVIQHGRLANGTWILQLQDRLFLYAQNDDVISLDTDGTRSFVHSFQRIFDLEQMAIGREDRQG